MGVVAVVWCIGMILMKLLLWGQDLLLQMTKQVKLIRDRMKAAQVQQNSYMF